MEKEKGKQENQQVSPQVSKLQLFDFKAENPQISNQTNHQVLPTVKKLGCLTSKLQIHKSESENFGCLTSKLTNQQINNQKIRNYTCLTSTNNTLDIRNKKQNISENRDSRKKFYQPSII